MSNLLVERLFAWHPRCYYLSFLFFFLFATLTRILPSGAAAVKALQPRLNLGTYRVTSIFDSSWRLTAWRLRSEAKHATNLPL